MARKPHGKADGQGLPGAARLQEGPSSRRRCSHIGLACCAAAALGAGSAQGATPTLARAADLVDLSLEQLGNIVVTSVARRPEALASAAASIYVISSEDIRRSGATTLPEALRLAPNLDVARADANQYAISARGFNNVLANKLLVLIDGRTVYTPLFSGVWWDSQDVMLPDVERIEVISGPGAALWGANAVNGVINIITRAAGDTQGVLASAGAGNLERGAAVRQGGALGDAGHYRVYAKHFRHDPTEAAGGVPIRDRSDRTQAGFRTDFGTAAAGWTVQGDTYWTDIDQLPAGRTTSGSNLLARYTRAFDTGGDLRVQAYYDHTRRDHREQFDESLDTIDVEAQYALRVQGRHRVLVGAGHRHARDRVGNSPSQSFVPADRTLRWSNVFVQDEIDLGSDVTATLGAKLEHNVYTGSEFLPSARIGWRASPALFAWSAVSRAVRAPSRIDRELVIPGAISLLGNDSFGAEVATVVEAGVRGQPIDTVSYAVTLFHESFDRLRSLEPVPGGVAFANGIDGRSTGIEAWGSWRVTPRWRMSAGVTALRERLRVKPGRIDFNGLATLGDDPPSWWSVRSSFDVTPRHELDVVLRRTGTRPYPLALPVQSYTTVDLRAAWRVSRSVELAVTAQNLFEPQHVEWSNQGEVDRGVFLKLTWTP
jgi:iron complex outermembrane receptor protein